MEASRRQSQEPQDRRQRHTRTRTIDGSQDPDFGASVGQTRVRQGESRGSKEGEGEAKQCGELLHASPELQDFLLELQCLQIRDVETHHGRLSVADPTTRRGAWDPEIRRDGHVAGVLDEIPKPVIVAALTASRGRHMDDHRLVAYAAQVQKDIVDCPPARDGPLRNENSLWTVQNVPADSSASVHAVLAPGTPRPRRGPNRFGQNAPRAQPTRSRGAGWLRRCAGESDRRSLSLRVRTSTERRHSGDRRGRVWRTLGPSTRS